MLSVLELWLVALGGSSGSSAYLSFGWSLLRVSRNPQRAGILVGRSSGILGLVSVLQFWLVALEGSSASSACLSFGWSVLGVPLVLQRA